MKKVNIWLIDDDEIYIFTAKKCMEELPVVSDFYTYKDGNQALIDINNSDKETTNVIFLDIHMPIMNGWQFVDEFEKLNLKNTFLYIVSSSIDERDMKQMKDKKCVTSYLLKPVTPANYKDLIDNII